MSGHSDFGNFQQFVSIFHFYLGADTASVACPPHPGCLEMISMILAAVI